MPFCLPKPRLPVFVMPSAVLALAALAALLYGCEGKAKEIAPPPAPPVAQTPSARAEAFRDRVLVIVAEEFPGVAFEKSVDPLILRREDAELHLGNLRSRCEAAGGIESCRAVIRQHFSSILESLAEKPAALPMAWEEARGRLRPQLTPIEYQAQMQLVAEPFSEELIIAFVLDAPRNYRFVTDEDRTRWGVSLQEIGRLAIANLEAASEGIPISASEGAGRLLAVEVGDGYDASRLLLPAFRNYAGSRLGGTFLAAIPNRDVLVMWSPASSPDFQRAVLKSIEQSFKTEPYPLSPSVFRVDPAGVREEQR